MVWMPGLLAVLGACAGPPREGQLIADPYEAVNRRVHEINKTVDRAVARPVARLYVRVAPGLLSFLVRNGAANLELPVDAVNLILQGKLELALVTAGRFGFNTVFGAAGLLDPATDFGLVRHDTDFGETLHLWGVREGAYVELPLLGPSTERDAVGLAVDILLNPVTWVTGSPEAEILLGVRTVDVIARRGESTAQIDAIFYGSTDSYAELKTAFVQLRRRRLGITGSEDALPDIFEDETETPAE
jgi:phospholipid-binding lipoprotein MlaA